MNEDRCVCCGEIIPEGRMVCWSCEHSTAEAPDMEEAESIENDTE